jgi:hypothetical protein
MDPKDVYEFEVRASRALCGACLSACGARSPLLRLADPSLPRCRRHRALPPPPPLQMSHESGSSKNKIKVTTKFKVRACCASALAARDCARARMHAAAARRCCARRAPNPGCPVLRGSVNEATLLGARGAAAPPPRPPVHPLFLCPRRLSASTSPSRCWATVRLARACAAAPAAGERARASRRASRRRRRRHHHCLNPCPPLALYIPPPPPLLAPLQAPTAWSSLR